jgi:hypothetical protein
MRQLSRDQLENRGFLVVKIEPAPFAKAASMPPSQSKQRRH